MQAATPTPIIETTTPRVVFVHGLFMSGREGVLLSRRLRRQALPCERFVYSSLRDNPEEAAARLASRLRAEPALHLIGHSLGAVIVAMAIAAVPEWRGRAVLLGPPLAGSVTARRAAVLPGGRRLLGSGGRFLLGELHFGRSSRRVLVIAGVRNFGVGRLIGSCPGPGDGQVRLVETRLAGAAHRSVRRGHMALLFDRRVARAVASFFRDGNPPGATLPAPSPGYRRL
ncbi:MAG TPA: alpha/beta hydrolase [Gammaproteobacteria bacterium]|nr:alpha/beta hydrolase [Gammaproteobacteria bacterium]